MIVSRVRSMPAAVIDSGLWAEGGRGDSGVWVVGGGREGGGGQRAGCVTLESFFSS